MAWRAGQNPAGVKTPQILLTFVARLKSCPFTKPFMEHALMCGRLAGDLEELVEDLGQGRIKVLVMGLLHVGEFNGLGDGPEDVVGLGVVDHQAEHGPGIGGAVLLVGVGGTTGGGEPEFEDEVGLGGVADQREFFGGFEGVIELRVSAIGVAAEWLRKQAAVGAGVGNEDVFCRRQFRRQWAGLAVGWHLGEACGSDRKCCCQNEAGASKKSTHDLPRFPFKTAEKLCVGRLRAGRPGIRP